LLFQQDGELVLLLQVIAGEMVETQTTIPVDREMRAGAAFWGAVGRTPKKEDGRRTVALPASACCA
jgi:hypothetical protein